MNQNERKSGDHRFDGTIETISCGHSGHEGHRLDGLDRDGFVFRECWQCSMDRQARDQEQFVGKVAIMGGQGRDAESVVSGSQFFGFAIAIAILMVLTYAVVEFIR